MAINLINLVGKNVEYLPQPIQKCVRKAGLELIDCYNAANNVEFLRVPMLIVESPIDAYSLYNIVGVQCLNGQKSPYSLKTCTEEEMKAIEQYRKMSLESFDKMRASKGENSIGIWGPACSQHGFTDDPTFTNYNFEVKGQMVFEAIQKFIEDPDNVEWNL